MIAKFFILLGVLFCILGILLQYVPGLLSGFGHLPGDIRIEQGESDVIIPLTTMIVLSVVISFAAYVLRFLYERLFESPIEIPEMIAPSEIETDSQSEER